jgi:hypothetical protein
MYAHKGLVLNICHLVVIKISQSCQVSGGGDSASLIITSGWQGLSCITYEQFSLTDMYKLPCLMTKCKMPLRVVTNEFSIYSTE